MKIENTNAFQFKIIINWRDHLDRLIFLSIFLIGTLFGILILFLSSQTVYPYLIIFSAVLGGLLLFYFLWGTSVKFNIEENSCVLTKKLFGIPFIFQRWQISNISKIVSVEMMNSNTNRRNPKKNRKNNYYSSVEIWGFREGQQLPPKLKIFSIKTYNLTQHTKMIEEIRMIVKGVAEYFQKLGLPIDYELKRTLK
ncbi:MAG: hypothetical protein ACTSRK_21285 [Promethearchaeota archaeon]